jgi:hypothetical protein
METIRPSKRWYLTTRRHVPEERKLDIYRYEKHNYQYKFDQWEANSDSVYYIGQ